MLTGQNLMIIRSDNYYLWNEVSTGLWRKVNDDVRFRVGEEVASHVRDDWIAEEFLRESPSQ